MKIAGVCNIEPDWPERAHPWGTQFDEPSYRPTNEAKTAIIRRCLFIYWGLLDAGIMNVVIIGLSTRSLHRCYTLEAYIKVVEFQTVTIRTVPLHTWQMSLLLGDKDIFQA